MIIFSNASLLFLFLCYDISLDVPMDYKDRLYKICMGP